MICQHTKDEKQYRERLGFCVCCKHDELTTLRAALLALADDLTQLSEDMMDVLTLSPSNKAELQASHVTRLSKKAAALRRCVGEK